jgi:hypothetical protein
METKEKENIKLKFGLTLKIILERNKEAFLKNKINGKEQNNLITSFGKLESSSGIPKATLVRIVSGGKNAAATTLAAILDAFEIGLGDFGLIYDAISEEEIANHKSNIENRKKQESSKRSKRKIMRKIRPRK